MKSLLLVLPVIAMMSSCMGIKASKHTYVGPPRGAELGGAEVRVAFKPEGTRPGAMMLSAMVVGGGFATFDGPFSWRVEALGQAGRHEWLIVHRVRVRTLKSGRDAWYPSERLGWDAPFRALKDKPQVVRARFPIPGHLEVKPEEDGGLEIWVDLTVKGPAGGHRKLLKFKHQPVHKDASEMVFLPTEVVKSIGTDPKDWDDPWWE